jgi:O-antigen/teichoic acid export membrane protein
LVSQSRTSGKIAINLVGNAAPLLVGLVTIPFVIQKLGTDRFGLLTVAWLFLGYFSLMDLGLGRATTKFVVEYDSVNRQREVRSLIVTATGILFLFGVLTGVLIVLATPLLVDHWFAVPVKFRHEAVMTFYSIAISMPFVTAVTSLRGLLEARHQFLLINLIKVPSGVLNYLIPACVVSFTSSLAQIMAFLVGARVLLFFVHVFFAVKFTSKFAGNFFDKQVAKKMLTYGGWLTISNVVGPIMVYFDRFIVGSVLTLTALSYYTTPYEMITKLLLVAASATAVLFPVFVETHFANNNRLHQVYNQSFKAIVLILFPVTLFFGYFSNNILSIWLDEAFSQNSSLVLLFLSVGVLFNSMAAIPFTSLQAVGRPDVAAKIHMAELPVYIGMLIGFTLYFGITGVAIAWMARNFVDLLILYGFNRQVIKHPVQTTFILFATFFIFASFTGALYLYKSDVVFKLVTYLISLSLFFGVVLLRFISSQEKSALSALLSNQNKFENRANNQ